MNFFGQSTTDQAVFMVLGPHTGKSSGGILTFNDDSSAGNAMIHSFGGSRGGFDARVLFNGNSTADHCTYIGDGAVGGGGQPGSTDLEFFEQASAGSGTFILNGSEFRNSYGAQAFFNDDSNAADGTFILNGGTNGGFGAEAFSDGNWPGGTSHWTINGNALFGISTQAVHVATVGSIQGDGTISLGRRNLTTGSDNRTTEFAGVIRHDGGSLRKIGTGTLTLGGANTYTGGTTILSGILLVNNSSGSGTGFGALSVDAGTLGGSGIMAGAVTIGTGSGTGAFLAPASGTTVQATLTIQSALTFSADATYTCTFKANPNRARTDQVIANGVTINNGAMIELIGDTSGALPQGLVLTLISNTSADPISGTFSNLPDGSIVTINGNNFLVSYSGGGGNDLTLTVVP